MFHSQDTYLHDSKILSTQRTVQRPRCRDPTKIASKSVRPPPPRLPRGVLGFSQMRVPSLPIPYLSSSVTKPTPQLQVVFKRFDNLIPIKWLRTTIRTKL